MADSLFKKLPDIWKDLDLRVSDVVLYTECPSCGHPIEEGYFSNRCPQCNSFIGGRGLLERFLAVPDAGVARIEDLIAEFLRSHNIQEIRDRFLPSLSPLTGHKWRTDKTRQYNRNRIQTEITRHSYKGTIARLTDDMFELGAEAISVQDNASKLLVLSRQGRLSEPDSYLVTANFWHDGAYLLSLIDSVVPGLEREYVEPAMLETVPAGTIWYLQYSRQLFSIFEMAVSLLHGQAFYSGDQRQGILGFGQLITDYDADRNVFLSWLPNRQVQKSYFPIFWHRGGTATDGTIGYGLLGDVFLSWEPPIPISRTYYPIYHHSSASLIGNIGEQILGELPLSWQPEKGIQISQWRWHELVFEAGPAIATEDSYSDYFWIDEVTTSRSLYQIHQKTNYEEYESDGFALQFTGYKESLAVSQGYLTGTSNLPGNIDDILGNQGTPDIPLTEYQASLQAGTNIDTIELEGAEIDGGSVTDSETDFFDSHTTADDLFSTIDAGDI